MHVRCGRSVIHVEAMQEDDVKEAVLFNSLIYGYKRTRVGDTKWVLQIGG